MAVTAVILMAALSGSVLSPVAVADFPGGYFDTRVRESFQRHVMASWPGPTELMRLWRDGDLSRDERVALLLGGAVYHDPMMLPAYREGLESEVLRVRQAAIYGYRDLIGDYLPNVDVTIDEKTLSTLAGEMRWMQRTLSRQPLLAMWLQSILIQEGTSLPDYVGVRLTRSKNSCFRSAERFADIGDLELLVSAYELARDTDSRIALLKLIESVTVSRFLVVPRGQKRGWGIEVFENAMRNLDARVRGWRGRSCQLDGEMILLQNLRSIGAKNDDPLGPDAIRLWLAVLESENSRWWALAARRLYACGGPWVEFSVLHPDGEQNRERRDQLIKWYEPLLSPNVGRGDSRSGR